MIDTSGKNFSIILFPRPQCFILLWSALKILVLNGRAHKSAPSIFMLLSLSVKPFPLITVFPNLRSSIVQNYLMFCGYAHIWSNSYKLKFLWEYVQVINVDKQQ